VPDVVYWDQVAAGEELVVGSGELHVRQDKVILPEFSGGREGKAAHFLSPQKTGLEKIRKCIIFSLKILHDFVIFATSHILGRHSPDCKDRGIGKPRVLSVGKTPALCDMGSGCHVGVLLQILRNKEMHCNLLTV
jgi:hypothetical protein